MKYTNRYLILLIFGLYLISGRVSGQETKELEKVFFGKHASTVLVAAHRAAHHGFPENSLGAVQHAIDLGVDIIEIDIRITADGVPVVLHDQRVDRTTDGSGDIEQMDFQSVRKLHLKNADGALSQYQLPTFAEVLAVAKGKILIDLDLKLSEIDAVVAAVQAAGMEKQVFFFDSDYSVLQQVKALNSKLYIMPRAHSLEEAQKAIAMFHPPVVHIDTDFYTSETVQYITKHHARVWINTLDDMDDALKANLVFDPLFDFLKTGANAIQTDEPELILEALKTKGLHQ